MTTPASAAASATSPPGLLLFAHGARDPNWSLPFEDVARRVRAQQPDVRVALAFLEFMTPDILTAGRALAESGCRQITIVPLFLGAGGHVRRDLPQLIAQLEASFPAVSFRLTPAVGEMDPVVEAMASTACSLAQGIA